MTKEKNLYVCPKCRTWASGTEINAKDGCPTCKNELLYVPVNYADYKALSDEDKASFKENFLNLIKEGKTVVGSYTVARNPETVKDSSGWISGMQAISWIVFAIFNIIGVCALINVPYGIVLFLGCFFVGFLSVGMTMVFLDMARDLKAIRTMLEKK